MFQSRMRSWVALIVVACFLWATSMVRAEDTSYMAPGRTGDEVTAEAMIVDGLLMRPAGIVAMVMGTAVFVVTLPFSIPTRSVEKAAQKLVVEPTRYTFVRPLGQIESAKPPTR